MKVIENTNLCNHTQEPKPKINPRNQFAKLMGDN